MRLAFGQTKGQKRGHRIQARQRQTVLHGHRSAAAQRLDGEGANMILQPRAPCHVKLCAGLQTGRNLAAGASAHDPSVAALFGGEDFNDRRSLAMSPRAQQDALIAPLHQLRPGSSNK